MQITLDVFCGNAGSGPSARSCARQWRVPSSSTASANRATYLNPVLGGDHPDAGAIRVGDDFFLTHSSFDYAPGLPI
jgi:beta-xylosidase